MYSRRVGIHFLKKFCKKKGTWIYMNSSESGGGGGGGSPKSEFA